jgi:hypothetical protein
VTQSWIEAEFHDQWTLSADELTLLPGMTDKGRLGFSIQLKFMQLHGRFPERHEEIDPAAAQWLGLLVHLMSKVPNWGFPARYLVDLIRRAFGDDWGKFTSEISNEISL